MCFQGCEEGSLSRHQILLVRKKQNKALHLTLGGYQVKELLANPIGEEAFQQLLMPNQVSFSFAMAATSRLLHHMASPRAFRQFFCPGPPRKGGTRRALDFYPVTIRMKNLDCLRPYFDEPESERPNAQPGEGACEAIVRPTRAHASRCESSSVPDIG
jgi:hypothetical protein